MKTHIYKNMPIVGNKKEKTVFMLYRHDREHVEFGAYDACIRICRVDEHTGIGVCTKADVCAWMKSLY